VLILVLKVESLQFLLEFSAVYTCLLIAFSSLSRRISWVHGQTTLFLLVFHLDYRSLAASIDVTAHFLKREDLLAEVTLSKWIRALYRLMSNQFLLEYSLTTAFTDNTGVIAFPKLMSSQEQFIISELVLALAVVALKPNLI
jgi:hypothetical protein